MAFYQRNNYGFNRNAAAKENTVEQCTPLNSPSTDTVTQLEFSREGEPLLAASSWDQTIRIWKFDDWSYQNPPTYLTGFKENSNNAILRFCFSEDCTKIYYGTTAGEIKEYFFSNKQGTGFASTLKTTNTFGNSTTAKGNFTSQSKTSFAQNTQKSTFNNSFGKNSTGFASKTYTPTKIPLNIPNYSTSTQVTSIPPSEYLVSGLKWYSGKNKIVVALTTNSTAERDYPHSFLGYVDPSNPEDCAFQEIQYHKIINIDLNDDIAWIILISSQDGTPYVVSADLTKLKPPFGTAAQYNQNTAIMPFPSEIQSMPTSIAAYPSGQTGYITATIQGFIEIKSGISPDRKRAELNFYEGVFRNESSEKSCETYSANCVAVCPFDKKIALVCSRAEVVLFNLETGLYRKFTPSATKVTIKDPITACAFSPSGEVYALAYGYDWSKGAEELKKGNPKTLITVGSTPETPKPQE